ncbi:F-box/LRR-repeat protein 4-like [Anneissia japonica]|uniref:F-box/LRR-repeat protein 4-like n=1 Tax=Anneissia japonica TaxID=1529436 RepID=UPI0014258B25|nr:F-box/LRR-repeat protein 4-like [Anneissia japonica]
MDSMYNKNCSKPKIGSGKKPKVSVNQFVSKVLCFSSQYGRENSIGYSMTNLVGPPNLLNRYEDNTQAAVLRTYGPWWLMAPSVSKVIDSQRSNYLGQDFVDLWFDTPLYPSNILFYETYHPGAVVEIYACNIKDISECNSQQNIRWECLYSCFMQATYNEFRKFSPTLKTCSFPTSLLRIVFRHEHLDYYTEIDAVELVGITADSHDGTDLDKLYKEIQHLDISKTAKENCDETSTSIPGAGANGGFDILPAEVIQFIFQHLTIPDLCRVAPVCHLFKKHCYDSILYCQLNIQPYWFKFNDSDLERFSSRCRQLKKLSLAWCGSYGMLTPETFDRFIERCGRNMECLQLSCCSFLNDDNVQTIAETCTQLKELNFQSCTQLNGRSFGCLSSLHSLQRLNLYRTSLTDNQACFLFKNFPDLEHLNLGSVSGIQHFDVVMGSLGHYCKKLKSLDLWRAKTLTKIGLGSLAKGCPQLLELDIGWCLDVSGIDILVEKCKNLKKLFLTSNRTIGDNDLEAIAVNCADLEQLDLLGMRYISPSSLERVLIKCQKMVFVDISFCEQITTTVVNNLKVLYPRVTFKKSFSRTLDE